MSKKYTLESETEHAYHLRHPSGATFAVAKRGLNKEVSSQIKAMGPVKMSDGGEVPELDSGLEAYTPSETHDMDPDAPTSVPGAPIPSEDSVPSFPSPVDPQAPTPAEAPAEPVAPPPPMPSAALPPPMPSAPQTTPTPQQGIQFGPPTGPATPQSADPIETAAQAEKSAIMDQAKISAGESARESKAYQGAIQESKNAKTLYDQHMAEIDAKGKQYEQAFKEGKVDPNRLWNSKTSGQKAMTMLSLFLGGLAGPDGASRAMANVQRDIDRDINAQVTDLGKKKNLLDYNLAEHKDIHTAYLDTQNQIWTGVRAQVASLVAQARGPMEMSRARQLMSGIDAVVAEKRSQLAILRTRVQAQSGGVPIEQESSQLLLDPKYNANRVQVGNDVYQAATPKEAEELRTHAASVEPVRKLIKHLDDLGPSSLIPGSQNHNDAQATIAEIIPRLPHLNNLSRLSDKEIELFSKQFKDPTKLTQLMNGGIRNSRFMQTLEDDTESKYRAHLMNYRGSVSSGGNVKKGFAK